jgi:SAM-dependent methyltransferase
MASRVVIEGAGRIRRDDIIRRPPVTPHAEAADCMAESWTRLMTEKPERTIPCQPGSAPNWAGDRGEKWRRQLADHEAMLRPIDDPLISALDLRAPCRIADIGCGSGATTREIRRRAPAGSIVHGFDLAATLIEAARSAPPEAAGPIVFEQADMGTASPPWGPYDRLVSRFSTMFFADPPAAFVNLRRWVAPGGRFAFAVWGPLADNPWMTTVREAVAEFIEVPPVDPAASGPFRYGDVSTLLGLLDEAGFAGLTVTDWRGRLPIGHQRVAADAARYALSAFSSFDEQLRAAGPGAFDAAYRALSGRLAADENQGVVTMPARVHIVTGTAEEDR